MLKKFIPILQNCNKSQFRHSTVVQLGRSYCVSMDHPANEPDYLESLKPKYPQHEKLIVSIKGYDFPILESYQRYLHGMAEYMEIDVADCYALPGQENLIQRLRPNSTVVDADYKLTIYERDLEIVNVAAPILPLFMRVAQASLPEGVTVQFQEYTEESEERRYVPDRDLLDLKAELDRMGGSRAEQKKK